MSISRLNGDEHWTFPRSVITGLWDGDTIYVDLDQGLGTHQTEYRIRVTGPAGQGFDAPELGADAGKAARAVAAEILPVGVEVTVRSFRRDHFSPRIDAAIELPDGSDFAEVMVARLAGVWREF